MKYNTQKWNTTVSSHVVGFKIHNHAQLYRELYFVGYRRRRLRLHLVGEYPCSWLHENVVKHICLTWYILIQMVILNFIWSVHDASTTNDFHTLWNKSVYQAVSEAWGWAKYSNYLHLFQTIISAVTVVLFLLLPNNGKKCMVYKKKILDLVHGCICVLPFSLRCRSVLHLSSTMTSMILFHIWAIIQQLPKDFVLAEHMVSVL